MSERWLAVSTAYLTSKKAQDSLAADPYWPKWDSPWWHMTLLWELGRADAIPKEAAEAMFAAIENKYVRFFPNPREPMPPGKDYHRDGLCHCGLGNMYQTLAACGLDLDHRAPTCFGGPFKPAGMQRIPAHARPSQGLSKVP